MAFAWLHSDTLVADGGCIVVCCSDRTVRSCTTVTIKLSLMGEALYRYLTDAQLIFALSLAMFAVSYFFWNDEVIDVATYSQ